MTESCQIMINSIRCRVTSTQKFKAYRNIMNTKFKSPTRLLNKASIIWFLFRCKFVLEKSLFRFNNFHSSKSCRNKRISLFLKLRKSSHWSWFTRAKVRRKTFHQTWKTDEDTWRVCSIPPVRSLFNEFPMFHYSTPCWKFLRRH